MLQINLAGNDIGGYYDEDGELISTPEGPKAIADAIRVSGSLTECNVRGNELDVESANVLANVATEKRVMLFGIKHDQTEADFRDKGLKPSDAVLIANDISVSGSLTSVDTRGNGIGGEGAEQLAAAVLGSASMVTFGGVPIKELRADALATLDLSRKDLGPTESIVLAGLLPVSRSLTQVQSNLIPHLISLLAQPHGAPWP